MCHPIGQPAIDPLLAFQPLGHLDAKRVTHQIGTHRTQPGMRGVNEVQVRAELSARRISGKHLIRS
jgi:hypothetical protein